MTLNDSQKNYIKKNVRQKSIAEIATHLQISETEITIFLRNRWGDKKYNKFLAREKAYIPHEKSLPPFHFKDWLTNNWFFLLALSFLVLLVYMNAIGNDFVADDKGLIINIPSYSLSSLLSRPFFFLRDFPYFVMYKTVGFNPFIFRLPNIVFHMGSVWLIFLLASLFKQNITRSVGIFSAALFAVHPILVESVAWISGGVYAQYTFFILLSFVFYLLSYDNRRVYALSLLSFTLSLLSSEKAVVFCLIPILYELSFGNFKKNWKKAGAYSIVSATYLFLSLVSGRLGAKISGLQADQSLDQTFYNPLVQIPVAITSYLQLIFWPDGLTLYHSEMIFGRLEYVIRSVLFILFMASIVLIYRYNKVIFFWMSFFIIMLLPTLTPLGISWVVAERYVYLSALGVFMVVAWGFSKLLKYQRLRMLSIVVFIFIIIALLTRTIVRNIDWSNEDHLWLASARTSPSSSQNHNNLGDYYGRQGDPEQAAREFKRAIELKPNYADAYHNLGNAYKDMGKTKEAIESYEKAISINPKIWQSYLNIAAIYYENNDFAASKKYLEMGLAIDPKNVNLQTVLGLVYLKMGDTGKARELLENVFKLDPTNQLAKEGLQEIQKTLLH